jgi:hypothetical protein
MAWQWTTVATPESAAGRKMVHLRAGNYVTGRPEIESVEAKMEIPWPHHLSEAAARIAALQALQALILAEIRRLGGMEGPGPTP